LLRSGRSHRRLESLFGVRGHHCVTCCAGMDTVDDQFLTNAR
jgi:hypothetical protein